MVTLRMVAQSDNPVYGESLVFASFPIWFAFAPPNNPPAIGKHNTRDLYSAMVRRR